MVTVHEVCVLICSTFIWNISHSTNKCVRFDQKWIRLPVKLRLLSYSKNLNFLDKCSKNTQMSNCMKIRPMGAELFLAQERTDEGQTEMTKLIIAFRNFTKTPSSTNKIENWSCCARRVFIVIQGRACHLFRGS